jgi:dCMP deaminase
MSSAKEKRYNDFYMDVALRAAQLSFANKRKVGAIAVCDGNILAFGFNGRPSGHPNDCEDSNGETLPSVIHAEDNMLRKLNDGDAYTMYVTKEPCFNCAMMLINRVATRCRHVYYRDRSVSNPDMGLRILYNHGISSTQI